MLTEEPKTEEPKTTDNTNQTMWIFIGVGVGVLVVVGIVTWVVRHSKYVHPLSRGYINDENIKSLLADTNLPLEITKLLKE